MSRTKSTVAYISIGSNLGNRSANIERAIGLVKLIKGVELVKTSSIYETEPVGGSSQGLFLNGVFKIKTIIDPFKLLGELCNIEKHLGRKRKMKNGPRTIDLDILLYGKEKINAGNLKIPHPRLHKREFVLRGLREVMR